MNFTLNIQTPHRTVVHLSLKERLRKPNLLHSQPNMKIDASTPPLLLGEEQGEGLGYCNDNRSSAKERRSTCLN